MIQQVSYVTKDVDNIIRNQISFANIFNLLKL